MTDSKRCHAFVSHHHADDEHVDRLTKMLKGKGYDIRNSSIRAKPANQRRLNEGRVPEVVIRRLLRMKISWAGTVVVLVGKETHSRPWVNWEIEEASRQGKRVVGVYTRGGTEADVPPALEEHGSALVGWNSRCLMEAIEGDKNPFETPDGTPRAPVHVGSNVTC